MAKSLSGRCNICGSKLSRASARRHLESCVSPGTAPEPAFHLLIHGHGISVYWLHVALPVTATLKKLDRFLREIWLECCGHLSAFTIDNVHYLSESADAFSEDRNMGIAAHRILDVGQQFRYEYDFGSTTELGIQVLGILNLTTRKSAVQLLARNLPPETVCQCCNERTAVSICAECECDGNGWLCAECLSEHDCGDEMSLPVINSPRTGVCGYVG